MKNKVAIMVLGAMALLVVAVVSIGVANGAAGGQELIVDAFVPEQIPGPSITLGKGEDEYAKLVLYEEGNAGGVAVGKGAAMLIATEPVNVHGIMGLFVYEIFGKGEIHISAGPGTPRDPGGRIGAIIGGTGTYRGVTGEYHHVAVDDPVTFLRITFKFNSGMN